MPADYDRNGRNKNTFVKRHRLRPEFIKSYGPKLNPDFFLDPGNSKQNDLSNDELSGAHNHLITKKFRSLLRDLDSFDYVPLSSDNIKQIFHHHGVNIRYMG